ncbi:hypothetical protein ScPMuIL_004109 [Solemya velum]
MSLLKKYKENCVSCVPGTYYSKTDKKCMDCPDDHYTDTVGQTECKPCPVASTHTANRSHCITVCPEGFTDGDAGCKPCAEDTYWKNISTCIECGNGLSTLNVTGAKNSSACIAPCEAGTYSSTGHKPCTLCPVNHYQDEKGHHTCKVCPANTITKKTGLTSINDCEPAEAVLCDNKTIHCNGKGTCGVSLNYKICTCDDDHYGQDCEMYRDPCEAGPCFNGGTCKRLNASDYECRCPSAKTCAINVTIGEKYNKHEDYYKTFITATQKDCEVSCVNQSLCMFAFFGQEICYLYDATARLDLETKAGYVYLQKTCSDDYHYEGKQCEEDVRNACINNTDCGTFGECRDLKDNFDCICRIGDYQGDRCKLSTDLCADSPCKNGGTCRAFGTERLYCICQDGFTGDKCETNINECDMNPKGCLYNGTCQDEENGYSCECLNQFKGSHCELVPDSCATSDCSDSGGLCYNDITKLDSECICEGKYEKGNNGLCEPEDTCKDVDCVNGSCQNGQCECEKGFEGASCQYNVDDCRRAPCKNGMCVDGDHTYTCQCKDGWTGTNCDDDINDCPGTYGLCNTTHTKQCKDEVDDYFCECEDGYTGKNCSVDIDECETKQPCKHGSNCTDRENGYQCQCTEGWEGQDCDMRKDFCKQNPCQNNGTCHSLENGFFCRCGVGTYGETCENFPDVCNVYGQNNPCINGGMCVRDTGTTFCRCQDDYTGKSCQLIKDYCQDADTCKNGGTCSNKDKHFTCDCQSGYTGNNCGTYRDPCITENCGSGAKCYSKGDKFKCLCDHGYMRSENKCKESIDDYDLIFESGVSERGALSIAPFVIEHDAISIMMFVQFAAPPELTTSVFKLYVSDIDDEERWAASNSSVLLEVTGSTVAFDNGTVTETVDFANRVKTSEYRKWFHLGITWSKEGRTSVVIDAIGHHENQNGPNFPRQKFGKLQLGTNYYGRLTRLTVWSRELTYTQISQASELNYPPMDSLMLSWTNFYLGRGTTRSYPSTLFTKKCGPILIDGCETTKDKSPPVVESCLTSDYSTIAEGRLTTISNSISSNWVEFSNDVTEKLTTLPADMSFKTGVHDAIYVAKDAEQNYAECRFQIYVKYHDTCKAPEDTNFETFEPSEKSSWLDRCPEHKTRSLAVPRMVSCGKLGVWDWETPHDDLILPPCSVSKPASLNVKVTLHYKFAVACTETRRNSLNDSVVKTFQTNLATQWDGLCKSKSDDPCGNLDAKVICDTDPQRKQEAIVEVVLSDVDETVYEKKDLSTNYTVAEVVRDIFLEQKEFVYELIGGAARMKETFVLAQTNSCPEREALIGSQCVTCGPGTYFNESSRTCALCGLGTYQDSVGQIKCESCDSGKTTLFPGSRTDAKCIDICKAGQYSNGISCEDCELIITKMKKITKL